MDAEKPKQDEKVPDVDEFERLLQERFSQWSQPFICPFCGKTDCKRFWHFVKLSTVSRSYLRQKHFYLLYGLFFFVIVIILALYMGVQVIMQK